LVENFIFWDHDGKTIQGVPPRVADRLDVDQGSYSRQDRRRVGALAAPCLDEMAVAAPP
jgi:hypothetical protein